MFGSAAWRLGRFGGIEIKIDPSWSFIAFLVGYTFYVLLDDRFPAEATATLVAAAILMTLVFFASVLLHELAHSWLARSRGLEVRGITLFLFGGVTQADLDAQEPADELLIAGVGPITSVAIAGVLWMAALAAGETIAGFGAGRLGWINLALAVFNLVPGFPLDGGRILRSVLWWRRGDLLGATRTAANIGRSFGFALIALGMLEIVLVGALIGGLWFIAIGWFLAQSAQAAFIQLHVKRLLAEVPVSQVMTAGLIELPADITVQEAVDEYFMRHDVGAFPVKRGDDIVGIVALSHVRRIPRDEWSQRTIETVALPLEDACTVERSRPMDEVVELLNDDDIHRVIVVADGAVAGIVTARNVTRWLQRSEELGLTESSLDGSLRS